MTFLEKVNDLSIKLLAIKEKFDSLDRDALLKSDLEELLKLEELLNFYINTVVELVIEENAEFVKNNKDLVKNIFINVDEFVKKVNANMNAEYF
jgi:hypothetical protein